MSFDRIIKLYYYTKDGSVLRERTYIGYNLLKIEIDNIDENLTILKIKSHNRVT